MSRENAQQKGDRYLLEGRLLIQRVDERGVFGVCRGGGTVYHVAWTPSHGWSCSCPARTPQCAHLIAAQRVTVTVEPREATA